MSVLWTGAAVEAATGGVLSAGFEASSVAIDSRRVSAGGLFVALRGETDGHAHVADAFARGAAGALVSHVPLGVSRAAPVVVVGETTRALADLGAAGRARFAGKVVAVTGSVGKTTTKDMLGLCLAQGGAAHVAEASHNNHWGVPLTLARLPADAAACVVEIGMNHAGEIAPLSRLARPDVVVVTAVSASHIGQLGSLEAIADEKGSIAAGLGAEGIAVLPADSPWLARLRAAVGRHRVVTFGVAEGADCRLSHLREDADGSSVQAVVGGQTVGFRLAAPGRHMAMNALAALAATDACGFDVAAAARALEGFMPGAGRGARRWVLVPGGRVLLLDESYNASSASVRAALSVLALQKAGRRIVVLGDMRELGAHSEDEHRGLAASVSAVADVLFTCGAEMRALFDAVPAGRRGAHAETAEALAPLVIAALRSGDAVLVKGSHGSRMRVVVASFEANDASAAA
jgi:UDP-N-acetylmuramoyl-tripeptide--D-alanyl-D-alanine ligase